MKRHPTQVLTPEELAEWRAASEKERALEAQLKARLDDEGQELLRRYNDAVNGVDLIESDGAFHLYLRELPKLFPGLAGAVVLALVWVTWEDEIPTCCMPYLQAVLAAGRLVS